MSKGCVNLCRKYFAVHKYIPYQQCCQLELCKLFTSESNESHDLYNCHNVDNGILLPKLFWVTVRKNCASDWEKLLKFKAEGQEFEKKLRSLEQFIQTVKG